MQYPALHDLGRWTLNQGCRPEEILELECSDLDLERSRLTIRSGKSRAARRQLRLTAGESGNLYATHHGGGFEVVFPGKLPGTHLAKLNGQHSDVLDALATCKCGHSRERDPKSKCACGCIEFREVSRLACVIYDLRHTFATRAAESGMFVATLAAILGHADLRSVMKYVRVRQEAQDRAKSDPTFARNSPYQDE